MVIDGKRIARDIQDTLKKKIEQKDKKITLDVFIVGSNYATEKFVALKQKVAENLGVIVRIHRFEESVTTSELKEAVLKSAQDEIVDGIIIQLSLPEHIDTRIILDSVPLQKDIDVLASASLEKFKEDTLDILPPVVGAIREILEHERIKIKRENVVIIGKGSLVGTPNAIWFKNKGANVTVVDQGTKNIAEITQEADIIVSGAGVPGFITKDMIKEGVVLLDAGTSESGGKLSGDADPECEGKCSVFTPVPGGIGPITIAALLQNLIQRSLKK